MSQKCRPRQSSRDWSRRSRRLHDLLASGTRELRSDVPDHFIAFWNVLEDLRYILSEQTHRAATVWTGAVLSRWQRMMNDVLTGKMQRKLPADRSLGRGFRCDNRCGLRC